MTDPIAAPSPLPTEHPGISLRAAHHDALLAERPAVGWLEVHAESHMGGGATRRLLDQARALWPLALQATGLSLGGSELPDAEHLERLAALAERLQPALVSAPLAWSAFEGRYFNDLLPLPYTGESLELCCRNVEIVQHRLKRALLVANPASFLRFRDSQIAEADFLTRLGQQTGCGILCDIGNLYVSSVNHVGPEAAPALAEAYLDSLPPTAVHELRLGGHSELQVDGRVMLVGDRGSIVAEPVWRLYAAAVQRFPHAATLLDWDDNLPPLAHLVAEADHARRQRELALSPSDAPILAGEAADVRVA